MMKQIETFGTVYKFKRYEDGFLEYIGFDNSMKDNQRVEG